MKMICQEKREITLNLPQLNIKKQRINMKIIEGRALQVFPYELQ